MKRQSEGDLILGYLTKTLTPEEEERFHAWLESDFKNRKVVDMLETIWNSSEKKHRDLDERKAWENLARKAGITTPFDEEFAQIQPLSRSYARRILFTRHPIATRILRVAAVIIFAISMHLFYKGTKSSFQGESLPKMKEISVDYGKTAVVTLMDGTRITLDAGSSLSYPSVFADNVRQVYLSGEGFFEVAPNPQNPFIICANNAVVRVLGTKFNVSAWPKLRDIRVAVTEGKVSFRSTVHPKDKAVVIEPGELSVLSDKGVLTAPIETDVEKHLSWQNRELILDNTPLYEALDQLERWYRLRFELPSPLYRSVKISGTIKKMPIDKMIKSLAITVNLEFERVGKRVVFLEKS